VRRVREQVEHVAPTRAPVLVEGEEGSGRRVAARTLHRRSGRRAGPLVWLECRGLSDALFETELCGSETHGSAAVPGRIEQAEGGTLVLHGVEHLGARSQVILLRLLQDRTFERVGGTRTLRADVRVVATAAGDLEARVRAGTFRTDLLHALALVRIALPPLRERRDDIPLLVEGLLRELAREHGRRPRRVTRGVVERLVAHEWPGNVTELRRVLEGLVLTAAGRGPIDVSALPAPLRGPARATPELRIEVGMTLEEASRALIAATLARTGGDKPRAAEMLGIGLRTLYRRLDRARRR
jgi:DNA-binding NtrC family response regulator